MRGSSRGPWRFVALCLLLALLVSRASAFANDGNDYEDDDENQLEIKAEKLLALPEVKKAQAQSDASLLWGTYRPQIYFGLRPRLPESLITGLAWFGSTQYDGFRKMRHQCSDQDGMKGYAWKYHDGRQFGIQEINDNENNYRIETSFLKVDTADPRGGSWGARISGTIMDPSKPAALTTFWYSALEGFSGMLDLQNENYENGLDRSETVKLSGSTDELGDFTMRIEEPSPDHGNSNRNGNDIDLIGKNLADFTETAGKTHLFGKRVASESVWKSKDLILGDLSQNLQSLAAKYQPEELPVPWVSIRLSDEVEAVPNFIAVQKTFTGNFTFDVFFDSSTTPKGELLTSAGLTQALRASKEAYDAQFERALGLSAKGLGEKEVSFARDLTSSVIGGIGYSYGASIVDRSFVHDYDVGSGEMDVDVKGVAAPKLTQPNELFTATPCRSIFPRGFYWDEGFHLAHIGAVDNDLSLDILRSWIRLIDEDGWVAREQILGDESRSRVPSGFETQYPAYANPPTLILAVTAFIDRLLARGGGFDAGAADLRQQVFNGISTDEAAPLSEKLLSSPVLAEAFLREIYPQLRRHYRWFRRTQRGEMKEWDRTATARAEAYRWRGRTKDHVLTSGLDDYPRAPVPHTGELHVDLMAWMGSFSSTMTKIARTIGEEDDAEEFSGHYDDITANLDDLHWNEEEQMYCDASVDREDQSYHVCHRGYVSILPLLLELLPVDSPHVKAILDLMRDPVHLWSPYGLRSLSTVDEYFGKDENYWRGPIWVQMSYLALRALKKKYASHPGPYQAQAQSLYNELRKNVIDNVAKEYRRTGYVYEQYNPTDGRGQKGHPFTGWTSTVALMMAEIY